MLNRMAAHFSDGRLDAMWFPWHELTYAQVAEFRTQLGRQYAPRTANNYLSTLKGVLRESKRLGLLDAATFDLLADQPPVRGEALPTGRHVEAEELERLFAYLGTLETASGARDRALFALLRGTGIRRAGAVSLDLVAYAPFRSQLTVEHGKGRKERVVFLPEWVIEEVDGWLDWRGHKLGLPRDGLRQRREPDAARAHARAMRLLRAGSRWAADGPPSLLSGLGSAPLAEAWRPSRDDRNPGPVLLPLLLLLRWSSSPWAGSQRFP
jgi:integrase